jgi:hypothetical protein
MLRAIDFDLDGDLDLFGIANGVFYVVANGSYATHVPEKQSPPVPSDFVLRPVYPNPVQNEATIEITFNEPTVEPVFITVYDITGRRVRNWTFQQSEKQLRFSWDTRDQITRHLPAGIYFIRAQIGTVQAVHKVLVLR